MCLLYALLTGESLSAEEEMMLSLHGLPAKCIAFAVNQLITGKDSWTEYHHCGLSERTFLCLLRDPQWLAHSSPATLFPTNTSNRFRVTVDYYCCNVMHRAMGNQHFLYVGFVQKWCVLGWIGFLQDMPTQQWSYLPLVS